MELTQKEQAAAALEKWINRLLSFAYSGSRRRKRRKSQIIYEAKALADVLCEARSELLIDERDAESAMAILHTPQGRAICDECMKAGF